MICYLLLFLFLLWFNYVGAKGRIEERNQMTNQNMSNLGPVSKKEREAFFNGNHKMFALRQAIVGSLIFTIIAYVIFSVIL
jgi:hypothetical protein